VVFFTNKPLSFRTSVVTDSPRPIDYVVSDNRVVFAPVPTPSSHSSFSRAHRRSMGFFFNQTFTLVTTDSSRSVDYSVFDN
jgi:hypothetical protein